MSKLFIVKQIKFCTQEVVNNFLITFCVFNKKKCCMSKMHGNGVGSGLARTMSYRRGYARHKFLITAVVCKAEGAAHIY